MLISFCLAIVIAPNLYNLGNDADPLECMLFSQKCAKFFSNAITALIEERKQLGIEISSEMDEYSEKDSLENSENIQEVEEVAVDGVELRGRRSHEFITPNRRRSRSLTTVR
jgi:hypothetical protein